VAAPSIDASVPVAIVGAGACGFTAALALREAGVDALLIERDAQPRGSTALSSGFIPAAPTRWQREAGVADSAERFAADIQAKAQGRAAPHLVQAYTTASAPAIELLARHGLYFELLDGFLYPGHSVRRMHALPEHTGTALVSALEASARAAGAEVLTQARVVDLQPGGPARLILTIERPDGASERLGAAAVLLACNGFGGNATMVAEHLPEMRAAPYAGHAGNDGTAIRLGRRLGAAVADLSAYQGHGNWAVPQGALISWALVMRGAVQLNARGERFHDETRGYSEAAAAVRAQPGGVAWLVFDDEILTLARTFADFRDAEAAGARRDAPDAAALAALIGCPADAVACTFERLAPGRADAFGRRIERTLLPPWHVVKVTGALFHTQGGLDVDATCRVRRADGSIVPRLWAAGGAARGVSGDAVWGYLSGNGLLSAVAGGFIAGCDIARRLRAGLDMKGTE
jgi:fumarate reductase flavoprotein subunit